jgi:predicted nucleic acid-binding protein
MAKKLLDSSVLIRYWRKRSRGALNDKTTVDAAAWGQELIAIEETDAIVTPVYLEVVVGTRSSHELRLTLTYLHQFRCVDQGHIPAPDWEEAIRLAKRVPADSRPRQLGDCLVKAIAKRLKYIVRTFDTRFPR